MTQLTERQKSIRDGFSIGPAQNRSLVLSSHEQMHHINQFKRLNASGTLQQGLVDRINDPQNAEDLVLRNRLLQVVSRESDAGSPFELTYDKSSAVYSMTISGQTVFAVGIDTHITNPPLILFARQEKGELLIRAQNCVEDTFLPFIRASIVAPQIEFNAKARERNPQLTTRFQRFFDRAA